MMSLSFLTKDNAATLPVSKLEQVLVLSYLSVYDSSTRQRQKIGFIMEADGASYLSELCLI